MSVDISRLSAHLPIAEQSTIRAAYDRRAKNATTAFLLCFFLGIFGAHRFYLGQTRQAWLRLVISPLIVPGLVWEIIDLFRVDHEVYDRNLVVAEKLVASAALAVPNASVEAAATDHLEALAHDRGTAHVSGGVAVPGASPPASASPSTLPTPESMGSEAVVYAANEPISADAPPATVWFAPLPSPSAPPPPRDGAAAPATPPPVWPIGDLADDPSASGGHAPAWPIANPPDTGEVLSGHKPSAATPPDAVTTAEASETAAPEGAEQPAPAETTAAIATGANYASAGSPLGVQSGVGAGALAAGVGLGVAGAFSVLQDHTVEEHSHEDDTTLESGTALALKPATASTPDVTDISPVAGVAPLADIGETQGAVTRVRVALPTPPDGSSPPPMANAAFAVTPPPRTPFAPADPGVAAAHAFSSADDLNPGLALVSLVLNTGSGDPTDALSVASDGDPHMHVPLAEVPEGTGLPVRVTLPEPTDPLTIGADATWSAGGERGEPGTAAPDAFATSGLFGLPIDSVAADARLGEVRAISDTAISEPDQPPEDATLALVAEDELGEPGAPTSFEHAPAGHEATNETLAELAGFAGAAGLASAAGLATNAFATHDPATHDVAADVAANEAAANEAAANEVVGPSQDASADATAQSAADEPVATQGASRDPGAGVDVAAASGEAPGAATTQPDAGAASTTRRVKRVRVVRRLVVNGQVVQEATAEQVVDADADTTATVANLQQTLGTTDPETLAALSAALPPAPERHGDIGSPAVENDAAAS